MLNKTVLGQLEGVDFQDIKIAGVVARVDSGAYTSAIWASSVEETENGLEVVFFDKGSNFFTGKKILFNNFGFVNIKSSNGFVQSRYKVQLCIKIKGDIIKEWFTLADRSKMKYPVLIGRNILVDKFLVDVSHDIHDLAKNTLK